MNVLPGLLILLCLIAFVSAEGHRSRSSQKFKVFKQRRLNPDKLGRQENYRDEFEKDTLLSATSPTSPGTGSTTTIPTSPTRSTGRHPSNKKNNKKELEYDQLVNSFDQEDLDDMIEEQRLRRRKNRRQSTRRRHRLRQ